MFEKRQRLATARTPVPVSHAAFLFADIVGFTAYTEVHGDARAAELAWRLRIGVEHALCADSHVVKTLGDAVMVRVADPAEASAAGLRIVAGALPGELDPPVRVGIACGPAVECEGDFFGAAVNLAARISAVAGPGEMLATSEVAAAARAVRLPARSRGAFELHNIARPVVLHTIGPGATGRGVRARRLTSTIGAARDGARTGAMPHANPEASHVNA